MVCTFIFGVNVGYFIGTAANEYFNLDPASYIAGFILFTSGLMGMAIIAEIMIQMPAIVTAIRKKWLGE
jgi:F0F1-type ATP synthase assembly protein I